MFKKNEKTFLKLFYGILNLILYSQLSLSIKGKNRNSPKLLKNNVFTYVLCSKFK